MSAAAVRHRAPAGGVILAGALRDAQAPVRRRGYFRRIDGTSITSQSLAVQPLLRERIGGRERLVVWAATSRLSPTGAAAARHSPLDCAEGTL